MNAAGIELLKSFEGCKLTAYRCPANVWTIGYGITTGAISGFKVVKGLTITEEKAEELLMVALQKYEAAVDKHVKVKLNANQRSALASFCYNIGVSGFARSSAVRVLNQDDYDAVPAKMALWNKAKGKVLRGLVRRRKAEGELFMRPPVAPFSPAPTPVPVPAPKSKLTQPVIIGALFMGLIAALWERILGLFQ